LIVCVLHNNDLNQVTWEIRATEGSPKFMESQNLPEVSYADFASSIGLGAVTVRSPDDLGAAWDEALSADRPTVLDVYVDPDMPPIPPHATFEQAKDSAESMLKGDPNLVGGDEAGHQDEGPGVPSAQGLEVPVTKHRERKVRSV